MNTEVSDEVSPGCKTCQDNYDQFACGQLTSGGGGFDITSSQYSYRDEVVSKDPICYGPCGSVLLVPIFLLEDS